MAGFGRKKKITGRAQAHEDQRRAELGEQQVLRHVERQQVLGERVHRREQRDRPERDAAVEGACWKRRDLEAAPARDAHGAHVERDADAEEDEHPGVERE